MTKEEAVILSAWTSTKIADFDSIHAYIEKKMGRPVATGEIDLEFMAALRPLIQEDFDNLKITE